MQYYTDSKGVKHTFPDDATPEEIQAAVDQIDPWQAPAPDSNMPRKPEYSPEVLKAHADANRPGPRSWGEVAKDTGGATMEAGRGLVHGGAQAGLGVAQSIVEGGPMGQLTNWAVSKMDPSHNSDPLGVSSGIESLSDRETANYEQTSGAGGTAGRVSSVVGELAPAIAAPEILPEMSGASLLPRVLRGGLEGVISSQFQAPADLEERLGDTAVNAGIGALLPVAGKITRKAFGELDPVRKAIADRLRGHGITVSGIQEYPSVIGDYFQRTVGANPGLRSVFSSAGKQARQFQDKFSEMLGHHKPLATASDALEARNRAGRQIENIHRNAGDIPIDQQFAMDVVNAEKAHTSGVLASQQNPRLMGMANDMLDMGTTHGTEAPGTFFKQMYTDVNALPSAPGRVELRTAVNDAVKRKIGQAEGEALDAARERYRIANAVRRSTGNTAGAPGINARKALGAVDRAAERGPVHPEAHQLLRDINEVAPPIQTAMARDRNVISAAIHSAKMGTTGILNKLMETGYGQRAINNPDLRRLYSGLLRAYGLDATSEDNKE